MTPTEYRCKRCGGLPMEDSRFNCPNCGRPMGTCSDCAAWLVRLFESDDPRDCDFCVDEYDPEVEERVRLEHKLKRQRAGLVDRSSAESQELSRIVAEAYRAAGRPRRVTRIWTHGEGWGECLHQIGSGPRRYEFEPATEAEWKAWTAWVIERDRLREELGVNRGRGKRHAVGWAGPATYRLGARRGRD